MLFQMENEEDSNKKLREISFKSLITEFPNFILTLVSAILSNSMIVWFDLMGSFSEELHNVIMFLVTRKIRNISSNSYHYDVERLEVMTSFMCDILMFLSYFLLMYSAFTEILNPSATNEWIAFYLAVKSLDLSFDTYYFFSVRKVYKKHRSKVTETEYSNWKNHLLLDLVVVFITVAVFFLRDFSWSWFFSPAATLLLSLSFIWGSCKRIKDSFKQLIDSPIAIGEQDKIVDILLAHPAPCIERIEEVKCFILDQKLHIVIRIIFKDESTSRIGSNAKYGLSCASLLKVNMRHEPPAARMPAAKAAVLLGDQVRIVKPNAA